MVLPPRGVDAVGVFVDAVERLAGDGPVREPVLAVEGHEFGALGEDDLVVVVHERRDVRPVEHRIVVLGRVDQPSGDLHVGFARTERDADGPRHAVAEFGLADPDGLAAVPVLDDAVVARDVRRGAVVVEDVPFDTARNPRSRHADVRRLDHVLVVEDVVAVGFVDGVEQPSADLRQDAQFDVFVFEVEGFVAHRLFVARHVVVERIGVDRAARPLVGPVAFEDGRRFGCVEDVGGEFERSLPGRDCGLLGPGAGRNAGEQGERHQDFSFHRIFVWVFSNASFRFGSGRDSSPVRTRGWAI